MSATDVDDPPGVHPVRLAAARVLGIGDGIVRVILSLGIVLVLIGAAFAGTPLVVRIGETLTTGGLIGLLLVPPLAIAAAVQRAAEYDDFPTVYVGSVVLAMIVLSALTKFL